MTKRLNVFKICIPFPTIRISGNNNNDFCGQKYDFKCLKSFNASIVEVIVKIMILKSKWKRKKKIKKNVSKFCFLSTNAKQESPGHELFKPNKIMQL